MISNAEIRSRARTLLGGGIFKNEWLYPLLLLLILSAISAALAATAVGAFIIYGILMCASSAYFIGRVRGSVEATDLGAAVDGAKADIGGALITGLLYNIFIMLWSMLFVIPGIVKSYSYALTYYVKLDNPELSPTEAITESRRLMNGYKMKLFLLDLSFFGWMLLGTLCLGVGTLWVAPYMEASRAVFYEEVRAAKPRT